MSIETEKLFKEFHKYVETHSNDDRTEDDIKLLMDEFIAQYNSNSQAYLTEETAKDSDDYLELAYNADNLKDAQKYAKKALQLDPYNFDAEMVIIDIKSKNSTNLLKNYALAVQKATNVMKKEGYFEDEYIGIFWGVVETRPYMRLRGRYVMELLKCGMIGQARKECEEMLCLCEGDNMGMRYVLMHIYAYFEDEDSAIKLLKKYDSYYETEMLLPLSILYYKKSDYSKALQYLRKLNGANKDLKKFLRLFTDKGLEEFEGFELEGGYQPGTIEEFMVELRDNEFLFIMMDAFMEWAFEQVKKFS